MKHHFADFLYREEDYWTMVPNIERYRYLTDLEEVDKAAIKVLTISKNVSNWKLIFDCPNLEELILHNPSKEQFHALENLPKLKRLRVSFFRTSDLNGLCGLQSLEELVFEYFSGFSDLSPLQELPKLKSLHLENLRGVSNFDGLKGIDSLRYLHISGTLDWSQPIENFSFVEGLPNLEVFSLGFIVNNTPFPAALPLVGLKGLRKMQIGTGSFKTREYALLQVALSDVDGCSWKPYSENDCAFFFLGKGTRYVLKNSPNAQAKCEKFIREFEQMKLEARELLDSYQRDL